MKIAIGCDHAGYELKEQLKKYLQELNHEVLDLCCYSLYYVNYPIFGFKVGEAVANK